MSANTTAQARITRLPMISTIAEVTISNATDSSAITIVTIKKDEGSLDG